LGSFILGGKKKKKAGFLFRPEKKQGCFKGQKAGKETKSLAIKKSKGD